MSKQQNSSELLSGRPYQDVATGIRKMIEQQLYKAGDRLPPERELAEMFKVARTTVREALIMLEIERRVEVKRGSGIYVIERDEAGGELSRKNDAGPFEMLQARQLLESNIAEFAAMQATRDDIVKMRRALELEEIELAEGGSRDQEEGDMHFHLAIAEATQNSLLVELFKQSWQWREDNLMWSQLHSQLKNNDYRREWLKDHQAILAALIKRDAPGAKIAMWRHLENVKERLLEFSNVDDVSFDGYIFRSWPLNVN